MVLSAYVSCPMQVGQDMLNQCLDSVDKKIEGPVKYWERNSPYTDQTLITSDIFVLILPDNQFEYRLKELTRGCKTELKKALQLQKLIFIAYRTSQGTYKIYKADVGKTYISGIQGTSTDLERLTNRLYGENSSILDKAQDEFYTKHVDAIHKTAAFRYAKTKNPCLEISLGEPVNTVLPTPKSVLDKRVLLLL